MSKEREGEDLMGYQALAQEALRGVVKAALKRAAGPGGLPGDHHFFITFKTQAPGVSIPPDLVERYPDEMRIVIQHQYWDLAPGETFFSVTLRFGGEPKRLSMPYVAITQFYDPSVPFALQFEAPAEAESAQTAASPVRLAPAPTAAAPADAKEEERDEADAGPKIVSLDQFRKK
jgi:uncharacterized protein